MLRKGSSFRIAHCFKRFAHYKTREEMGHPTLGELDVAARSVLTGVPEKFYNRQATIFRPSKTAMQDGYGQTQKWKILFDKGERWNNSLTGWISTRDPLGILSLEFSSEEEAIAYCVREGYPYVLKSDHSAAEERVEVYKSYADNFKYKPPQKDPSDIF